eukprot:14675394-Alexandrium_andersonii.AAC.1
MNAIRPPKSMRVDEFVVLDDALRAETLQRLNLQPQSMVIPANKRFKEDPKWKDEHLSIFEHSGFDWPAPCPPGYGAEERLSARQKELL